MMEEGIIIRGMIQNVYGIEPQLFETDSGELIVMLSLDTPDHVYHSIRGALAYIELYDYTWVYVSRGEYFTCLEDEDGELVDAYYLADLYTYFIVSEELCELADVREMLIAQGAQCYIDAVLSFYFETHISVDDMVVEHGTMTVIIDDPTDPYFMSAFPYVNLRPLIVNGDYVVLYSREDDLLILHDYVNNHARTVDSLDELMGLINPAYARRLLPRCSHYTA